MNVERLSNAWLYPAICHPVFSNSSIVGLSSAARVALPVTAIIAMEANGNSFIIGRPGVFIELNAFFDPLLFQFSTKNIGTVPALAVSMLELSDIATLVALLLIVGYIWACISP